MRLRSLPPTVLPLLIPLLATAVLASPPVPSTSYVAPCLVACPAGDSTFVVVTRTAPGTPWSRGFVAVEFCDCEHFRLGAGFDRPYIVDANGCTIFRQPDVLGVSLFPITGGGPCGAGEVRILADGIPFGTRKVATPDQNGDWIVTEDDIALLTRKTGLSDPSGDFNCDGVVSAVDLAIAWSHLGHMNDVITTASTGTWGALKIVYR